PDRKLRAGRDLRQRVRETFRTAVRGAGINPDGPAGPGPSQSCSASVSARAGGTRCAERKTFGARERIGPRGIRPPGQGDLAEHAALLPRRWTAAADHRERRKVSDRRENVAARGFGASHARRAAEL